MSKIRLSKLTCASVSAVLCFLPLAACPQSADKPPAVKTQIVLLGTGTPSPDPDRSGPATAIVVNGTPYLIDFGPGVVRRAAARANPGGVGRANPEEVLLEEIRQAYGGNVITGHDLDIF